MNDYDKEIDKLFVGQHSDDCAINVTGEGFPCICWVAEAKAAISALLVSARKDGKQSIVNLGAERLQDDDMYTLSAFIEDAQEYLDRTKPEGE